MSSRARMGEHRQRGLGVCASLAVALAASACSDDSTAGAAAPASAAVEATWKRELLVEAGERPRLFYAVYGEFEGAPHVSRAAHRSAGVPGGVELSILRRGKDDEALERLCSGPMWESMGATQAAVAAAIDAAPACVVMQGEVDDARDLGYLRDAIGVVAALLEQGGVAVYDPLAAMWFDGPTWTREFFEHGESRPQRHVQILMSEERAPGRAWFHTRGMRKFGRPDVSVHCVPEKLAPAVLEMINRFVVMQAQGALIDEGRAVVMSALPDGGRCTHAGSHDDPEFNNTHLEIAWPADSELACEN